MTTAKTIGYIVGGNIDGAAYHGDCQSQGRFIGFMRDHRWQYRCDKGHWFIVDGDAYDSTDERVGQ